MRWGGGVKGGVAGGDLQSVAKSRVSEEGVFRLRRRELGSQAESGVEGGGAEEWRVERILSDTSRASLPWTLTAPEFQ